MTTKILRVQMFILPIRESIRYPRAQNRVLMTACIRMWGILLLHDNGCLDPRIAFQFCKSTVIVYFMCKAVTSHFIFGMTSPISLVYLLHTTNLYKCTKLLLIVLPRALAATRSCTLKVTFLEYLVASQRTALKKIMARPPP